MAQSSIFPIFLRAEYKDSTALRRFESDAQRAAQTAKREFSGVSKALGDALSRPRNAGGSLDLGVDELRKAAAVQQQVAAAARQVAEATKAAALASGGFESGLGRAARAAFELANAEERATQEMREQIAALDAVQAELNKTAAATTYLSEAQRRGAASADAQRGIMANLGFQLNDVATQFALGASATQIFASQGGQIIQVLQQMAENSARSGSAASEASGGIEDFGGTVTDTADRAKDMGGKIGAVAAFLSGPWGIALTTAAVAVTPFIGKLLEGEKSADELSEALDGVSFVSSAMGDAQSALGNVVDITTGKIKDQTAATVALARAQLQVQLVQARLAGITAETTLKEASQRRVVVPGSRTVQVSAPGAPIAINPTAQIPRTARSASAVVAERALKGDTEGALKDILRLQEAGKTTVEIFGEISEAAGNLGVSRANVDILENALKALDGDRKALAPFLKPDKDRKGSNTDARRAAREAERLAEFGEQAAERIARINEGFNEQPRLIDRASQATRELDKLIAELSERKPAGFEKLIEDAKAAKGEVEAALVRPFEQLREESEQRLRIEELLAQGRGDEAAALQEVIRIERERGGVTAEQRREVEQIVRAEAERTRYLRDQQRLWQAQLDVVDQVQRSLTDLFSGRGGNLFRDFRQVLQDLAGQRMFEDLFGDAFRDIRRQLEGQTPQGKANARYAAEVEKTAGTTTKLERSLASLADSADMAAGKLRGGAANDNPGGFSPRLAMVSGAIEAAQEAIAGNTNGMTVTADRPVKIARVSILDLAKNISAGIGNSIAAELEPLLGPRFAELLGDTIGGVIAGKTLGGTPGAILGGLQGLADNIRGLERVAAELGKGLEGAITGTRVNAGMSALGIKGSQTGAQIGGALGNFIPGLPPGIGSLVGSVIGNVVGGLLKSAKRGSATIGGSGSSLDILSTVGNSAALKDTANGLAGNVLDSINEIARQLGATVDAAAGRVSIGQRKDNLRVDPSGRGATKIGNGAIDFGQDAEAAIAFAVQDLIKDGVIKGLKASENRLLQAAKDVEAGLRDVLTFRSVFDRLKAIEDPIGAAIDEVTREFDGLREVFKRAGADAAELASLEKLYGIERAQAIEDATDRVAGSLKALLADLRIGDNGLSLRTRQANALTQYNGLAARVAAGDAAAFDDFAEVSKQLLDIERQLFGSTQSYFDRLEQVTSLSEQAIAGQTTRGGDAPIIDQTGVIRAVDLQTSELASRLDQLNANLIAALDRPLVRSGGGGFASEVLSNIGRVANF